MGTLSSELESFLHFDFTKKEDATGKTDDTEQEMYPLNVKPTTIETLVASKDSLENIVATQKQLSQVKESLGTIIDTMAQNPSLFTRASTYFGEMQLWQKIAIGLGLSVPTLAAGIFAHVGILLVISGVTVVTYTAAGIVLDDHHSCNVNIAERLKAGIFNLADVLQLTIDALDNIRQKLAEEIEKFKAENIKLAKHVNNLGDQIETLSSQVQLYMETEKLLRATKDSLEEIAVQLKDSFSDQSELLKDTQDQLEKATKEHKKSQEQLSEKIIELNSVKVEMGLEVEKARIVATTLQGAVSTLTGTVITDKKQRDEFQKRLDGFLEDKEKSFDQVADRIFEAERELASVKDELRAVKEELNRSLENHKALLVEQGKQINRLEAIPGKAPLEAVKQNQRANGKENMGELLSKNGIYATKKPLVHITENSKELPSHMAVKAH